MFVTDDVSHPEMFALMRADCSCHPMLCTALTSSAPLLGWSLNQPTKRQNGSSRTGTSLLWTDPRVDKAAIDAAKINGASLIQQFGTGLEGVGIILRIVKFSRDAMCGADIGSPRRCRSSKDGWDPSAEHQLLGGITPTTILRIRCAM
eukprot:1078528-Rhodomonas_salina.1